MPNKLLILHTVGTISMAEGEDGKVAPSAQNPLLIALNKLHYPAQIEQEVLFNLPSPHIHLGHWAKGSYKIIGAIKSNTC